MGKPVFAMKRQQTARPTQHAVDVRQEPVTTGNSPSQLASKPEALRASKPRLTSRPARI
jgi:hypothetical protein